MEVMFNLIIMVWPFDKITLVEQGDFNCLHTINCMLGGCWSFLVNYYAAACYPMVFIDLFIEMFHYVLVLEDILSLLVSLF